jgi:hypothetical protein
VATTTNLEEIQQSLSTSANILLIKTQPQLEKARKEGKIQSSRIVIVTGSLLKKIDAKSVITMTDWERIIYSDIEDIKAQKILGMFECEHAPQIPFIC